MPLGGIGGIQRKVLCVLCSSVLTKKWLKVDGESEQVYYCENCQQKHTLGGGMRYD